MPNTCVLLTAIPLAVEIASFYKRVFAKISDIIYNIHTSSCPLLKFFYAFWDVSYT